MNHVDEVVAQSVETHASVWPYDAFIHSDEVILHGPEDGQGTSEKVIGIAISLQWWIASHASNCTHQSNPEERLLSHNRADKHHDPRPRQNTP